MKAFKYFCKFLLALTLLLLVLWGIILGTLQTKTGQEWAFHQVRNYLERNTQTQIEIKKISFSFPLNFILEDAVILQDHRPILTIQNFELCCAYTKLLQGRIIFSKLQASNIDIIDLPLQNVDSNHKDSNSWDIPPLPFYVKIENLDIQDIKLRPQFVDSLNLPEEVGQLIKQTPLNLNGVVSNNPFKSSLTAHLLLTAKHDVTGLTPLSLGLDTQNHQLSLSFHLNQLPLKTFQPDLPSHLRAHLALHASAPIESWQNLAQGSTIEDIPIEGHLKLILNASVEDPALLSTLISQQTTVRSHYFLKSKNAIELINLKIENPSLLVIGEALLTSDGMIEHGQFQGEIDHLDRFQTWLGKDIQGKLAFEGQAQGSLLLPAMNLHLKSPQLLIAQQLFQNIRSTLQVSPQKESSNGFFTLAFDYHHTPWKAASSFDWNHQKQLTFSHVQIEAMNSRFQGEMTYSTLDSIWQGFLEAYIGNFQEISHFLEIPISGDGQLKMQFASVIDSHNQRKQEMHAEFLGHAIRWKEWQAQQLLLHAHLDPLNQNNEVFKVQTLLEGKQIKWNDYFVEYGTASSWHTIDPTLYHLKHLSAEWKVQDIQWPTGKIREAAGQLQLQDPLQSIEGQVNFALHQLMTPTMQLEELIGSTTLHPSEPRWPFYLRGKGKWKERLVFSLDGNWHYQHERMDILAQHLSGQFGPYPLQIKQPMYFTQQAKEMELRDLWLQLGEAELQADYHQNAQQVVSNFKTNAISSELLHLVVPDLPIAGKLTLQGHLEGSPHQPKGQFQIDFHGIQIIEDIFANKPFIAGRLLLNLDEKGAQLTSELNGIGQTPLLIAGHLPLSLSMTPLDFKVNSQLPFELSLNAEGELDPYLHLFYNDTTNLSGHTQIALKLSGQMNAPQIKGHIHLINGAYESLSTGALYHNIQAHLEGDGSKIILTNLSAQDNKNGQISATGTITLDTSKQFPFEFHIQPSRIFILDSDYVDVSASGRLTLVGNTKKSKLQGELNVDQASIHLEEALPHQIKNIDIRYINVAENDLIPKYFEKHETSSPIELDVKVNASQNVRIEGNHLKSDWKGSFLVTGTPDNPQLHGDLRISQGEYNFNGKVFNLSQGNIHFAGALDKKTSLYIVASKDIDRITAEIIVKGTTNKPAISFRSNPPLPQREVLSYILFNRGISDITVDQGEQLSQSFISLNSSEQTKSSDDFLSRLRNNIGIDRLDFTTNDNKENKDFGLQVGKHITEDIMVSVNQGMTSLSPIIAVEAKLRKNLKAQAEAGMVEDAPIRMSIKWKKDY